jgi:hypothetical protein
MTFGVLGFFIDHEEICPGEGGERRRKKYSPGQRRNDFLSIFRNGAILLRRWVMAKRFGICFGICLMLFVFPPILIAQSPTWHSDALIENNAGNNGFSPKVAMSGNNVVAVWYQLDGNGNYRIYSNYSTDGGATWGSAQLIENNAGFDGFSPEVAVSGSNVVAVWMQVDGNGNYRIYSNYSGDGGVTWNANAQLVDDHPGFSGGFPEVAMSGLNVVVVWEQEDATTFQRMYSDYSTDGGATWHADRSLEDNTGYDVWFPQVAMSGNNAVAVWYQPDAASFRIYSNYSNDGGETWHTDLPINTGDGYVPEVAISGLDVVVVWARYVGGIFRISSNYSSDGGATWGSDQLIEDNAGVPIGGNYPQVAISGSNAVAVWQQYDGTTNRISSNYSSDGGATWNSDQLIEDNAGLSGSFPQVAMSGNKVVSVWMQWIGSDEDGAYQIHSNHSTDGGVTWGSDQLIEDNIGYYADSPQVAMSESSVVAVWRQRDGEETLRIYSNYATFEAGNNFIDVFIDIKPGSCPNPLNVKSKGVLPVAVLGSADFDVSTIDPATVRLSREGVEGEVPLLRWSYEDVGTPFEGELCGCHALNGDGYADLSLKFDMQALIPGLELGGVKGNTLPLTLTGNLKEEFGGTPVKGQDCVWVLK